MAVQPLRLHPRTTAFVTTIVLFTLRSLLIAWFTVTSVMNAGHFTYWNYTLGWLFYGFLIFVFLYGVKATHIYTLFVLPLVSSSVFVVALLIIVILFTNDWLLVEESKLGHGKLSLGEIHAGGFVLHTWPLLEIFLLLLLGYATILRQAYKPFVAKLSQRASIAFHAYWFLASVPLLLIYAVLFDPMQVYPTPIPLVVGLLIVVALLAIWFVVLLAIASIGTGFANISSKAAGQHLVAKKEGSAVSTVSAYRKNHWEC